MQVTGYALREALRKWQLKRETAAAQFADSLFEFPTARGKKPKPDEIAEKVDRAERAIAGLQTAQGVYNSQVWVHWDGPTGPSESIQLTRAIKLIGAFGRVEKLWRIAATGKKDKYAHYRSDDPGRLKEGELLAERTVTPEEAADRVEAYAAKLGALRQAVAIGNATPAEIDLDASLLE